MKKYWKIAGIATLVAVVGVVAVGAVALAQEPPWKPPFLKGMPFDGSFGGRRGHALFDGGRAGTFGLFGDAEQAEAYREQMHEAIAEALGLTVEKFDAAIAEGQTLSQIAEAQGVELADVWTSMETARQGLVQQAVVDGLLTQEEADSILERMADGGPGSGPFGRLGGGRGYVPFSRMDGGFEQAGAYREQMHTAVAEALGLTVEEFDAAIAEGQTPCQIAEAKGLDLAEVWAATESARQDLVQQAVADGLLTQAQADWIGERMADQNLGEWCTEDGPAHGKWGMGRGFHGFPVQPDIPNQ